MRSKNNPGNKLADKEIEKILANVKGSFAIDGIMVTDDEESLARRYLKGEITEEEALKIIKGEDRP